MSTTPSEDELDHILVNFGQVLQRHSPEDADVIRRAYKDAKAALAAHTQAQTDKAVIEARIDERQKTIVGSNQERIRELNRQLTELDKQKD